jgi:hypothetical protein
VPTSSVAHLLHCLRLFVLGCGCLVITLTASTAQTPPPANDATLTYQELQTSHALNKSVFLENVDFQRDRVTLHFVNGFLYFPSPVAGKVRSAVFVGSATVKAEPPPVAYERDNFRRLLRANDLSTDFKTAVFRFTDDTIEKLLTQGHPQAAEPPEQAKHLAADLAPRLLEETGMNISARQLGSILNHENPGIFLAQFDGGKNGRFSYLFDPQARIPVSAFRIDGGEKGLIFAYDKDLFYNDVWMAFHAKEDYDNGQAPYSDNYNLVDTSKYALTLDLLEPKKFLGIKANVNLTSRIDGLRLIPFVVGEDLSIVDDERRKRQLHIVAAHLNDGTAVTLFQEPWEGGFAVVLPKPVGPGQPLSITLELRGEFMEEAYSSQMYFPRSTVSWYPRHGALPRCPFDISILHRKKDHVVAVGELVKDSPMEEPKDSMIAEFRMDEPIALATFAVGPYEVHKDVAEQKDGSPLPLEFYSLPGGRAVIKEDFILAEMNNSVRFFSNTFGRYPYHLFRGVYHPFPFGQGFPTTIMIPAADRASYRTYSFIAHETSHQWWGDIVLWRSYHDQWLSEGFADYSGMLYAQLRDKTSSEKELIRQARETLKNPPHTRSGIGTGRLVDVGPLIMGHRLETRETRGAYSALTYSKGALVLRMLHYLFTDPATGDGQAFFDLMTDFVNRYKNSTASTDQFFAVANERIPNTALAQKFGFKDLQWFYRQWVTETYLPTYELTYHVEPAAAGAVVLKGELLQKGVPDEEKWFMPIPLVIHFPGGKAGSIAVSAFGPRTPVTIKLPQSPEKIELDPDLWILTEKTSTAKQ